ncbi:unnamed protein product [Brassica napus]|nr:unnamed protein product [Brassica napus]
MFPPKSSLNPVERKRKTERLSLTMMMMITTQNAFWILLIFSISMASASTIPSLGGPGIGTNYGRYSSNLGAPEIGINYGRYGSNLPPPEALPSLVTSLSIKHVKTFDMDPRITTSFANTGISLSLCIPNDKIPILSTNLSEADSIIRTFILPYHKTTIITSISVGNEVSLLPQFTPHLVSAVVNFHRAIKRYRLHKKIKVTTTHSLAILSRRFPPSTARFHNSIGESVLKPLVRFLQRTKSPLMVNVYPYLAYKQSFPSIPLDFALFQPVNGSKRRMYRDPYSGVAYTNLFDIMMDSVDSAVKALGLPKIPVVVSEIGWPSSGDPGEVAASLEN